MNEKDVIEVCNRGDDTYGARLATPAPGGGYIYEIGKDPHRVVEELLISLKGRGKSDKWDDYQVVLLPREQHF